MTERRKTITCEIEVPHTPSLHLPSEASLAAMLKEYANRKQGVFHEYYTRCTSPKKKVSANIHEARMARMLRDDPEEYAVETRAWHLHRDECEVPAPRFGDELSGAYDVRFEVIGFLDGNMALREVKIAGIKKK